MAEDDDLSTEQPQTADDLHKQLVQIVADHDEAWNAARNAFKEDFRFAVLGEQWDEADRRQRELQRRPALTYNRLPAFIRRVTNDARQEDQQVRVVPAGAGASQVEAELLQGLIRGIQIASDASSCRSTAHDSAAIGGFGFYRIAIDEEGGETVLRTKRIRDALQVTLDPWAIEADRSDMQNAVVRYAIARNEFKRRWPNADLSSIDTQNVEDSGWVQEHSVTVAEVWRMERRINPATGEEDNFASCYWISGAEVLDAYTDYPGHYIPIVPIFGEEWEIDGKVIYKGLVRDAKTPQTMLNYWKSATAENLAQNRRARADVPVGMVEGFEDEWSDDTLNIAYRRYNPGPNGEKPSYPPPPQIPTGTVQAAGNDAEEIKAILGIFDASLGAKSNESSGRAIMARAAQGDLATFHFKDNLSRAIRLEGKILVDLIPHVYSRKAFLQVASEDGEITTEEMGAIKRLQDGTEGRVGFTGAQYGVVVTSGPGYATKRQETLNLMIDAARVVPQIAELGADKLVGLMDFSGSYELAQRLKRALPPNIVESDKEGQIPPQVQAQLEQMGQTIDQLTQALQQTSATLEDERTKAEREALAKIEAARLEAETKIRIAQIQAAADLEIARIQQDTKRDEAETKAHAQIVSEIVKAPSPVPPQAPEIENEFGGAPESDDSEFSPGRA